MYEHNIIIPKKDRGLISAALDFATAAHDGQLRKYTGDPYIVHPIAVAEIVSRTIQDSEMICAALLHDVIEDTDVTYEDIVNAGFRGRIARLVVELTDVSKPFDGNREVRKTIDRMHTAEASRDAHTIKLADLIDNTSSIVEYDLGFAKMYMREKRLLLDCLKDGNSELWDRASKLCELYDKYVAKRGIS